METMNQNRDGFGAHLDKLGPGAKSQELEYSWLSQILGVGIAAVEKEAGEFAELHNCEVRCNSEQSLGYFQRKKNG